VKNAGRLAEAHELLLQLDRIKGGLVLAHMRDGAYCFAGQFRGIPHNATAAYEQCQ